jgi:hypothetical protein
MQSLIKELNFRNKVGQPIIKKGKQKEESIMKNKASLLTRFYVVALVLLLMPAFAFAQQDFGFRLGDKEFTIVGQGRSDSDLDNTIFTTAFSLGQFFTNNWEGSVRQTIEFVDTPGENDWRGATSLAADYHFGTGRLVPLIGAAVGYTYGDRPRDEFFAAPEAGVKWFVNQTTFIQALAQYQFPFDGHFDDGSFVYGVGVGFRF